MGTHFADNIDYSALVGIEEGSILSLIEPIIKNVDLMNSYSTISSQFFIFLLLSLTLTATFAATNFNLRDIFIRFWSLVQCGLRQVTLNLNKLKFGSKIAFGFFSISIF